MGTKQRILIADPHYLVREGLKKILDDRPELEVIDEAATKVELFSKVEELQPDIITLDCNIRGFCVNAELAELKQLAPGAKFMVVTSRQSKSTVLRTLDHGINSYILKECSKEEIIDAACAAGQDGNFFCGKVLDLVLEDRATPDFDDPEEKERCEPVTLSDREREIVRLISQEYTNKEIAEQLYISPHTVITHRKNIMKKLNVRNTAGLVLYAIQNELIKPAV